MSNARNMTADDKQCLEFFRMFCKGASVFAGLVADMTGDDGGGSAAVTDTAQAEPTAPAQAETKDQAPAKPTAPAQAETKAPAEAETAANDGGQRITRTDVQRAMAAKVRELAAKGSSPDVVGQLLPKFHGAGCVSDLKAEDYPAFLEELAKL